MEAPASAIDEGRRGGRSERSDSRRVKGRQPRERKRGWQCCSCEQRERSSANVRVGPCLRLHCCWPYSDAKQTPPPGHSARRASKEPRGTFGSCVSHVGRTDACFRIRNISFLGNPDRIWTGAASLR